LYPHTARALGPIEVVGVVGDAVYSSLRGPVPPTFYMTLAQFDYLTELGIREINLSYRSHTESPIQLTRSVATAITSVDPQLSLTFSPLLGQVNAALTQERVVAQLSGFFGVLALLLAGLGLFGVTAQSVASRRTEIGIRMALGATPGRITVLTLRRAYIPVGVGVAVGAGLSLAGATLVRSLVYGIEPRDAATLAGSILVLSAVAGIAAWFPTRRAVRTNPATVLQE
jgi:ABC-type antimicrobial peptide transport system permease subunit